MKNLYGLVFIMMLFSCSSKEPGYVIKGELSGFPDSTMIYLANPAKDVILDSALIIQDQFVMKGMLEEVPASLWIHGKVAGKFFYTTVLMGNEQVRLKGDLKDFPFAVKITGSVFQDGDNRLDALKRSYDIKRDSLTDLYLSLSREERGQRYQEIWGEVGVIDSLVDDIRIRFVKDNPTTYCSVIELYYLKENLSRDSVAVLYQGFTPEMKASPQGRALGMFLKNDVVKAGDACVDFTAEDKDGNKLTFSGIKGDYILLDFTSAFCGPCILAAQELRKINDTYGDSVKIISYNCDESKKAWLGSLERDSVNWLSLWDGQGRDSEVCLKYAIRGYPTFVLIGPDRKIMDQWFGYGEGSLEKKLERFCQK